MNDYKSITQIAAELGVTRQAVYKKIKSSNELSTSLQKFTVNQGKFTVYSLGLLCLKCLLCVNVKIRKKKLPYGSFLIYFASLFCDIPLFLSCFYQCSDNFHTEGTFSNFFSCKNFLLNLIPTSEVAISFIHLFNAPFV